MWPRRPLFYILWGSVGFRVYLAYMILVMKKDPLHTYKESHTKGSLTLFQFRLTPYTLNPTPR